MDGILNLYKPLGLTSTQALERVRRITGWRKSGHAGSLDPLAEGVLLIGVGRGTKLTEALMDQPKVYRTMADLSVTSPSFDRELPTSVVEMSAVPSTERVVEALRSFEGAISQTPPATSAVKVNGRPAYKLARRGQDPVLQPRTVHVYGIRLLGYAWPHVELEVTCGRGTYIRALVRDLGARLGTGGCLDRLLRTAVGPFRAEESWTLERLERAPEPAMALITLADARRTLAGAHAVAGSGGPSLSPLDEEENRGIRV